MLGEERKRERARGGVKKIEMEKDNTRENDREREQRDRERECQWQREQHTDPRPYRELSNHRTPPHAALGRRHPFPTLQVHVSVFMDVNTCISDINQHTHTPTNARCSLYRHSRAVQFMSASITFLSHFDLCDCMHVRALREVYVVESVVYDVMLPLALACGI